MISARKMIAAAAMLFVPFSANGMTLSEAFDQAAKHDPAIPQSLAVYESERYLGRQVSGARLPQINATGQIARAYSRSEAELFPSGRGDGVIRNAGVELRQPLFRRDWLARGRQADALDERAEVGRDDRIQLMILRVAERYFAVLREREALDLARAEMQALETALNDTRNRHQAGVVAVTDLREAQARFDLARAGALRAESALASAQDALHEITDRGYVELPELRHDMTLPALQPQTAEGWLEISREHSLVLREAKEDLAIARAELSSRRSDYSPRLDAIAAYRYDDTLDFPDGQERRDRLFGVELTVPLYNGGVARARSKEAAFRAEAAAAQVQRLTLENDRLIRQLFRDVEADRTQVEALELAVVSAESAREATDNGYQAGTRTILDLLDAETRLADAQRNYADARFGLLLNTLNLRYQSGILAPDDLRAMDVLLTE